MTAEEGVLTDKWAAFVSYCEKARKAWESVAKAAAELDGQPTGEPPLIPFPADLERAFREALRPSPGSDPFAADPRVPSRRIATVSTGTAATDTRGFAGTFKATGDW